MRTIGKRKERPISFSASATLLAEGARFNDEIHRLPTGNHTGIAKGIYRFKSFDEANRQDAERIAQVMAESAQRRA
jgi:hypothetical protein